MVDEDGADAVRGRGEATCLGHKIPEGDGQWLCRRARRRCRGIAASRRQRRVRAARAHAGSAPTTSANPPVLAKGTASDATIRIRIAPNVISTRTCLCMIRA